jgi:hypothetical protein
MAESQAATPGVTPGHTTPAIKSDTDQQVWLGSPHIDNLTTMVVALSAEVWAGRQRTAILEKLLARKGVVVADAVESYAPTQEEFAAWEAERQAMAERIFKVAMATPAAPASGKPQT